MKRQKKSSDYDRPEEEESDADDSDDDMSDDDGDNDISDDDYYENDEVNGNEGSEEDEEDMTNIPLAQRLEMAAQKEDSMSFGSIKRTELNKVKKRNARNDKNTAQDAAPKRNKNAPLEMRSNKPVGRFRQISLNSSEAVGTYKPHDPRFSDLNGRLNSQRFYESYDFLDEYQQNEVAKLEKALKKCKSTSEAASEITEELMKMRQQMSERRKKLREVKKVNELMAVEKSKIKDGKKPFFLKKNALKEKLLEDRYDELKKEGKLKKFIDKKRKRNSSKDHRWLPTRRIDEDN
jgi:ribosomal RNA-processing protein 36